MKKIGNVEMDSNVIVVAEFYPQDIDEAKKLAKVLIDESDGFRYVNWTELKFVIEEHTFGYIANIAEKAKYRRLKFKTVVSPMILAE